MTPLRSKHSLVAAFGLAPLCFSLPNSVRAQPVTCELREAAAGSLLGDCVTEGQSTRIELSRPDEASDVLWIGTIESASGAVPIEIATYQYSTGPELIVRTRAWHIVSEFVFSRTSWLLAWNEGIEAPPSQTDLEIFEAARLLLPDEEAWDREDDRNCENDEGVISVYCALAQATASLMGRYQHRQPAMQAVRRVIGSEWPERVVDHRLMNFNNDDRTTLADVHRLFDLAAQSLRDSIR